MIDRKLAGYYGQGGPGWLISGENINDTNRHNILKHMGNAGVNLTRGLSSAWLANRSPIWAHAYPFRNGKYDIDKIDDGFVNRWGRIFDDLESTGVSIGWIMFEGVTTRRFHEDGPPPFDPLGLQHHYLHEGNSRNGYAFSTRDEFYSHQGVLNTCVDYISQLLQEFGSHPSIEWIEVINEGPGGNAYESWRNNIVDAIRQHSSKPIMADKDTPGVNLWSHRAWPASHRIPGPFVLTDAHLEELKQQGIDAGENVWIADNDKTADSGSRADYLKAASVILESGGHPLHMRFDDTGLDQETKQYLDDYGTMRNSFDVPNTTPWDPNDPTQLGILDGAYVATATYQRRGETLHATRMTVLDFNREVSNRAGALAFGDKSTPSIVVSVRPACDSGFSANWLAVASIDAASFDLEVREVSTGRVIRKHQNEGVNSNIDQGAFPCV